MKRIARAPSATHARSKPAMAPGSGMRGQALVETALVLPVLLLLLLMAVDFGRLFMTYVAINNAAREGAFYAAEHAHDTPFVGPSFDSAVRAAALREVNVQGQGGEGALAVSAPVCHVTGAPSSTAGCDVAATSSTPLGYQVTVSVTQPFSLVTPIVGDMFGGSIDLSATSTAPVLNAPTVTVLPSATPTPTPTPTATPTTAPTPTPTPDPAATPTPTPDPAATPTPTPTPTPEPTCTVPDLIGQYYNTNPSALFAWQTTAGFSGTLVDSTNGHEIKSQSRSPGGVITCSSTMEVSQGKNLAYKG